MFNARKMVVSKGVPVVKYYVDAETGYKGIWGEATCYDIKVIPQMIESM